MYWTIPRVWEGKNVHIIGGGPSITQAVHRNLAGRKAIAINNAFEDGSYPITYFQDESWFSANFRKLREASGWKITCAERLVCYPWLKVLKRGERRGFSLSQQEISRGTHSGYGAINLAVKLGAKRIILYGFDMQRVNGRDNYHDRHERKIEERFYAENARPIFQFCLGPLERLGVEVLNACPTSALDCFPKITHEEGFDYD